MRRGSTPRPQSHLRGIESTRSRRHRGATAPPQSHLRGIESDVRRAPTLERDAGLNRTSEASKVGDRVAAAVEPASRPQSHLRGIESRAIARASVRARRRPQSHLRGIERREREPSSRRRRAGLNRTSEASKVALVGAYGDDVERVASIAPQRHRKYDRRAASASGASASIAPQRHRKSTRAGSTRPSSRRPQSHLRGIESLCVRVLPRPPPRASIAPQRHRKARADAVRGVVGTGLNRTSEASKARSSR